MFVFCLLCMYRECIYIVSVCGREGWERHSYVVSCLYDWGMVMYICMLYVDVSFNHSDEGK